MKRQTRSDRLDESLGERRGKESGKKQSYHDRRDESKGARKHEKKSDRKDSGYKSAEAKAGHRYNESAKHHRRESEGMKKYWRRKRG